MTTHTKWEACGTCIGTGRRPLGTITGSGGRRDFCPACEGAGWFRATPSRIEARLRKLLRRPA